MFVTYPHGAVQEIGIARKSVVCHQTLDHALVYSIIPFSYDGVRTLKAWKHNWPILRRVTYQRRMHQRKVFFSIQLNPWHNTQTVMAARYKEMFAP